MYTKAELIEAIKKKVLITSDVELVIKTDQITEGSYLFDFRRILLNSKCLNLILDGFLDQLATYEKFQVGGIESAAIPLITGIALRKGISGFYMRKSRKKSGLLHQFEGEIDPSVPIILVDDILNSAQSILKVVYALEKEGIRVSAVCTVLRYHPIEWYSELTKRNIKIFSLVTHEEIAPVLGIPEITHEINRPLLYHVIVPKARFFVSHPRFNLVTVRPTPYFDGKNIYTGMDDGFFYAIDPHTLEVVWKFETKFGSKGKRILSSATGNGKYVFFGSYDGNFYALSAATGDLIWKDDSADWIGSSPCYIPETNSVCVGMEYAGKNNLGGYTLFDAETGKIIWATTSQKYTHGSPIYSKKHTSIFGGSNDGIFYRIDLYTGKILWMASFPLEIKSRPTLSEDEEYVIFGTMNGELVVLECSSGKIHFQYKSKYAIYTVPFVVGERVYFSSLDKNIYAIDLRKKELIWEFGTAGRIFASPVVKNGIVYCGSNDGDLYLLDANNGKVLKKWIGTERIVSPVTFINEENYVVRTIANELYLF